MLVPEPITCCNMLGVATEESTLETGPGSPSPCGLRRRISSPVLFVPLVPRNDHPCDRNDRRTNRPRHIRLSIRSMKALKAERLTAKAGTGRTGNEGERKERRTTGQRGHWCGFGCIAFLFCFRIGRQIVTGRETAPLWFRVPV